jgi:hypothetical protein
MLLGCCHCGEEPSDSLSESGSSASDTSEAPIETLICVVCQDSVAPRFISLNFGYSGTTGVCCSVYSAGTYSMEYDAGLSLSIGQTCGAWKSSVLAKQVGTSPVTCNPIFGSPSLCYFFFTQSFGGTNKYANVWIRFRTFTIHYRTPTPLGSSDFFDCLNGMTLNLFSGGSSATPCETAWPSSVSTSI